MSKLIVPPELAGAKHVFEVTRTSLYDKSQPPCEEAVRGQWQADNGRTFDVWVIAVDDIESLLRFVDKHGQIVIDNDFRYEIEIYDGWRE